MPWLSKIPDFGSHCRCKWPFGHFYNHTCLTLPSANCQIHKTNDKLLLNVHTKNLPRRHCDFIPCTEGMIVNHFFVPWSWESSGSTLWRFQMSFCHNPAEHVDMLRFWRIVWECSAASCVGCWNFHGPSLGKLRAVSTLFSILLCTLTYKHLKNIISNIQSLS